MLEIECVGEVSATGLGHHPAYLSLKEAMPGDNAVITTKLSNELEYKAYIDQDPLGEIMVVGAEIEMALLFMDIRNFTPFVEAHISFDVIYLVKKIFSAFGGVITEHGGKIIETTGDGLYVAFSSADRGVAFAANNAVAAGFAMFKKLEVLNMDYLYRAFGENIEIGIGIHVGKVGVGTLTLGSQEHEIVMGYPVNVAARLEGLTKKLDNNFIVSEQTFRLLTDPPHCEPTLEYLKGIHTPFIVYPIGTHYTLP